MSILKKTALKVLHPKRTRAIAEDDDSSDSEEGSWGQPSSGASQIYSASPGSFIQSRNVSAPTYSAANGLASVNCSSRPTSLKRSVNSSNEAFHSYTEAPEPNEIIAMRAVEVPDKGKDAEMLYGNDSATAEVAPYQLSPIDRHYLNKALVQSVMIFQLRPEDISNQTCPSLQFTDGRRMV